VFNVIDIEFIFFNSQLEKENNLPYWAIEDNEKRNELINNYQQNKLIKKQLSNELNQSNLIIVLRNFHWMKAVGDLETTMKEIRHLLSLV
jgi:hypothetical protein